MQSRRSFLSRAAAAATTFSLAERMNANPMGRQIGLQLYTVGEQLGKDFDGTLQQIAAIGYREVELADTYHKSAAELRKSFADAGVTCRSAHMFDFKQTPEQFMDFARELGVKYVVSSFNPPAAATAILTASAEPNFGAFVKALDGMTLDDYRKSAETCNHLGEEAKKRGMTYAYHNHNLEFKKFGEVTAYDTLLRSTDPDLVKMELDCGWVAAAGYNPVAYLNKYSSRIKLLHIKAFKTAPASLTLMGDGAPEPTELGRGGIDYKPVFAAALKAGVDQYYVEQEPPFKDMTAMEAIKVDFDYLHAMQA